MHPSRHFDSRALAAAAAALALVFIASSAHAQRRSPYEHALRLAVFPVAFQAGVSQSWFGSAVRGEVDIDQFMSVHAAARLPWLEVAGEKEPQGYTLRGGIALHLVDRVEHEPLMGTVYAVDVPAVGGQRAGTDTDMDVPVSQKLGGPPSPVPEHADGTADLRVVHALRVGYERTRSVERLRPNAADDSTRHAINDLNMLYLGYAYSSHWNLTADEAGERSLGFRRFYVDALFTLPDLYDATPLPGDEDSTTPERLVVGGRVGVEGAIDALIASFEELGFGYTLEAGVLPGDSGLEGYLLVGLGVELDVATRSPRRR